MRVSRIAIAVLLRQIDRRTPRWAWRSVSEDPVVSSNASHASRLRPSTHDPANPLSARRVDVDRFPRVDRHGFERDGACGSFEARERARRPFCPLEHHRTSHDPRASIHGALTRLPARDGLGSHAQQIGKLRRQKSQSLAQHAQRSSVGGAVRGDLTSDLKLPPLECRRVEVTGPARLARTEWNAQAELTPPNALRELANARGDARSTLGTILHRCHSRRSSSGTLGR